MRYFICLLYWFGAVLYAQDYSFKHLQVEDGLSHNSVICMLQDKRGFLWFGTKDGLNRYDGYNFKIYQHNPNDVTSIGSNFIRCLIESGDILWVGTDTGLFKYDERMESFSLIEATKGIPILDIECNNRGELWFIAGGSLFKMNLQNDSLEKYDQFYSNFLASNLNDEIFITSQDELYKYEPDNNSFQKQALDFNIQDNIRITALKTLNTDKVYIGTKNNGAFVYDLNEQLTKTILSKAENPLFVRDFLNVNDQELWIASESGIFVYQVNTGKYINLKKNYGNPYALSDNAIYTMLKDKEEGIWVGSYFGGVNYYPKPYTPFKRYFPRVGENSISGNAVREIEKDDYGNLWIGTEDGGLNKFNLSRGYFTSYTSKRNGGDLSHYNIHGLHSKGNELWIGTFEHGLDVMDIPSGEIIKHYGTGMENGGLRSDFILYVYETEAEEIIVLTSSGIHKYEPENDSFIVLDGFPEAFHYTYFLEDSNGVFWAGTYWDGLYYYNPKTKQKGVFKYENNNLNSISSNVINGIFEDSSHRLWITTENGLNLYQSQTNDFKRYNKTKGLSSNVTYEILEDDKNQLWISSSNGLMKFSPENNAFNVFTKSNGLLSDQFNYSSSYRDESGEMYFGSVKGLISFNPSEFTQNKFHPPIFVTDIYINNEVVPVGKKNSPLKKSILFSNQITLNNDQSSFTLEIASLSFTSPEMTQYWYKLEGLNEEWVDLGKNQKVNFMQLPPGDYEFKVKALNNYEVWSESDTKLLITILPPFYSSKIAYAVYTLFIMVMGYLLLRYYHRYQRDKNNRQIRLLENRKEKEIYQAKIEFFTNVAHEIRTPLTLIKGPLEKLLKQKYKSPEIPKNLGIMEKNTMRLLKLINELLDFRKTEMKHVKLSFVKLNINEVLYDTYVRFSQLIQDKKIEFELKTQSEDVFAYADEEAFSKVLSNLFNNAIKYSKHYVQVVLTTNEENFQITVSNDGPLIPKEFKNQIFEPFYRLPSNNSHLGTGIGLSLAHSLVELHNGKLWLDHNDNLLNSFSLQLPLHQNEEFKEINAFQDATNTSNGEITIKIDKHAPLILLAEDNRDVSSFLFDELSENYNVIVVRNGNEAWRLLQKHQVSLIISDVMMPIKNGIELCELVKQTEETRHIPFILLTAKSALNAKIEGLDSGADAYITKPFSIQHLLVQISNLIKNRRIILEHYSNSPLAHLKSLNNSNIDKAFINKLDKIIEENLEDPSLNVDKLSKYMNMSRSTLYRSISEMSDLSPNELINVSRLKRAAHLIKTTNFKLYEVADKVGFKSQTSFGRSFLKNFGMTPSEFEKSNRSKEDSE
ncbi:two-component regulator propeller domain-containing protein [Aestuariibaculum sp. M13]|uniref:two-component regulator propeller domain-containing protein n=1 Tax=Aestuariibaculum sp. M13 TaxID=2967132 RepID=UPI002159D235|nr:two-component regulator propeller domain-containing protein [Aestuariibaculum sp. M13]